MATPTDDERHADDPRNADDPRRTDEERRAELRRSSIEAGRRKGGAAGAAMAGAMLAIAEIYEGPRRDDAPVTVEASGDPHDVDRDGIELSVAGIDVAAPALERIDLGGDDRRGRPQV